MNLEVIHRNEKRSFLNIQIYNPKNCEYKIIYLPTEQSLLELAPVFNVVLRVGQGVHEFEP